MKPSSPENPASQTVSTTLEHQRQASPDSVKLWAKWGPYLSDRAWGTVREDYSPDGNAWNYFSHDMARSRAYRWSEDGIAGISDEKQILCFAPAFWNGRDPILKERFFGLTNAEGNHGEDVKEYWFHLDNLPSHAYMKMVYRYPLAEFPYRQLVEINRRRGADQPEYELVDTGVFADNAFFDIQIEYAKADPGTILFRCTITNRSLQLASLHVLPTVWFRNTWAWGKTPAAEPAIRARDSGRPDETLLVAQHPELGTVHIYGTESVETLFTFNETNRQKLFNAPNTHPAVKDAFHDYLIGHDAAAVHQESFGTKAALHYQLHLAAGGSHTIQMVISEKARPRPYENFDAVFTTRIAEADAFYATMLPQVCDEQMRLIQRRAFAGLLWSKQFYNYDVGSWVRGDTGAPAPESRLHGRNSHWKHLESRDIIVMPDKWEYPWFAAWDWAFHALTLGYVDVAMAKQQLELICSERYQNLSGQLPAYEWAFGDVNPPVQALAVWRIYNLDKRRHHGQGDFGFLERMYHKLLINFVWWVNRKDRSGNNIFEGGFLGLDNISVFDRSRPLPNGEHLEQADATGWMGLFCLNMMTIGLELSQKDSNYSHLVVKFLDHFAAISSAINSPGHHGLCLWDETDGFYYDTIAQDHSAKFPLRVRSLVGLIPLLAVQIIDRSWVEKLPAFKDRSQSDVIRKYIGEENIGWTWSADSSRCLLSIANKDRLQRALRYVVDENEFLSPFGLRSVSKFHQSHPFSLGLDNRQWEIRYEPAESTNGLFGGNSNWRGPIWFPTAYLLVTALRTYHHFYGPSLTVPIPGQGGKSMNLLQLSEEISRRMIAIFMADQQGRRPVHGGQKLFQENALWKDMIPFHEYFNGEDGAGLGASHQTGWTALVVQLIDYVTRSYERTGG